MNQSTRTLIFVTSFLAMLLYYLMIIPHLPQLGAHPIVYTVYDLSAFFVIFPLVQMVLRRRILNRFRSEALFKLEIVDAPIGQMLLYIAIGYIMIWLPSGRHIATWSLAEILTLLLWLVISAGSILGTYRTTKAHFTQEHILIYGYDARIDFPFGNSLYSHSGIYSYSDFDSYRLQGTTLVLQLRDALGKVTVKLPDAQREPIVAFVKSKQIKLERV